jgi:predicted glycogen debranching enzyme
MKLPALTFPKESLTRFDEVLAQEWLLTNGFGSYAASTVPGVNTRKYHGLLVAALNPPGDRTVCFSKLDEDVVVGDKTFRLGANEFRDTFFPEGYKLIRQFQLNPYPSYIYDASNVVVKKIIFLPKNKNATVVLYNISNRNAQTATLKLYPLLTCRYFHTVVNRNQIPLNFTTKVSSRGFHVSFLRPEATLHCQVTEGQFVEGLNWVDRLHYRDESSRGEADLDDCFQPGYFMVQVAGGDEKEFALTCAVSREAQEVKVMLDSVGETIQEIKTSYTLDLDEKLDLLSNFYASHSSVPMSDWLGWVLMAADSFVVQDSLGQKSVLAGYHWFESWGRDSFISLPGLLLVTGRYSDAKDILVNYMRYLKGGLIPNFVADKTGVPVYNTVDATLWYINAVLQYVKYTGDYGFVRSELWQSLQSIIENHRRGTMFGIKVDSDGLLLHGPRLTWMDAAVEGDVVTPRVGKAVEIQALWYNALKTMEMLAAKFKDSHLSREYAAMAELARRSFNMKFWNPQLGYLYDVVDSSGSDASLRPNQIFTVSLDYCMLDKEMCRQVVDVVNRELVTPYGLRTLSLNDPKFVGKCFGDRRSRDSAYHNGTIWPWLLGPYVSAYLKVNDYSDAVRKVALEKLVLPLFSVSIHTGGLGTVSEIYDCEPPNEPRGCISQAWSVAEPLRAYIEDILQIKPKFG